MRIIEGDRQVPEGYEAASWLPKLQETETIVGLDLDETLAIEGDDPSVEQLQARSATRNLLRNRGVVQMAQSMRSWELMLSSGAFDASPQVQHLRKRPCWSIVKTIEGERYIYEPIEKLRKFSDCLDWDAALVPGNGIIFMNGTEYIVDWEWDQVLNYRWGKDESSPRPWREGVREFVEKLFPTIQMFFSPLEYEANYYEGTSNVLTLAYRIQLDFLGSEGFQQKEEFKRRLFEARETNPVARRIKTIDESNPQHDRYTLYLVPWWGRKESLLNRFVRKSCETINLPTEKVFLPLAGDTLTDLRAGLYGGIDAQVSFLLPENSRLTPYLAEWLNDKKPPAEWARSFAGESLHRLCTRLKPTNRPGVYSFEVSTRRKHSNKLVFGHQAYPGKVGAVAVHAFLQDELSRSRVN